MKCDMFCLYTLPLCFLFHQITIYRRQMKNKPIASLQNNLCHLDELQMYVGVCVYF